MPKWKCSIKEGIIGRPPTQFDKPTNKNRWMVWDHPWTEDVKQYDCPQRISYFGRRICWMFGAPSQKYDWRTNQWTNPPKFARLTFHPRNYRERYARRHVHMWQLPHNWILITPQVKKIRRRWPPARKQK